MVRWKEFWMEYLQRAEDVSILLLVDGALEARNDTNLLHPPRVSILLLVDGALEAPKPELCGGSSCVSILLLVDGALEDVRQPGRSPP